MAWVFLSYSKGNIMIAHTTEAAKKDEEDVESVVTVLPLSDVWLFVTPWIAAHPASLSFTVSQNLLKLISIESMVPSNHFNLWRPLLLLLSIFPRRRVFSNDLVLYIRWPKFWTFSFSISPSSEYLGMISMESGDLLKSGRREGVGKWLEVK